MGVLNQNQTHRNMGGNSEICFQAPEISMSTDITLDAVVSVVTSPSSPTSQSAVTLLPRQGRFRCLISLLNNLIRFNLTGLRSHEKPDSTQWTRQRINLYIFLSHAALYKSIISFARNIIY